MTKTATPTKDLEKQLAVARADCAAAEAREQAATARAQELGAYQLHAAALADRNIELERRIADLAVSNEQLVRDAKAARAEASDANAAVSVAAPELTKHKTKAEDLTVQVAELQRQVASLSVENERLAGEVADRLQRVGDPVRRLDTWRR